MKRRLVLVASVAVVAALAVVAIVLADSDGSDIEAAPAFSIDDLRAHGGADWLTTTGGLTANRYSTLSDINTSNVAGLKVAWHHKLGIPAKATKALNEEATPVAYKGTLYLPDGKSAVYALDGATGKQLWKYDPKLKTPGLANRGVGIGDGRVYIGRGDAHVVALDQKTGKELWNTQLGVASAGYSFTSAPVFYNGMVLEGMSGGDSGARSFAVALNAKTGKEKWRWYVAAGPGEVGSGTWTGNEWQHGGGIWIYPSIAPSLGLLYIVTGNPVPWNGRGPGDNLWTDSIVALRASNGQFAWGFQTVHHDIWDYDVTQAPLLFDTNVNGVFRHGVAIPSKTGWVYLLDRATGKPLLGINEKKVPQYPQGSPEAAYANLSPTQPYPVGDVFANQCATRQEFPKPAPDGKPLRVGCIFTPYTISKKGTFVAWKPAAAVDWPPSSYDPETHFIYLCTTQGPGGSIGAIPKSQQLLFPGGDWIGANFGGGAAVASRGQVIAMDVSTNKIAWKGPDWPAPCYSGLLTTAGGLVFGGQSETKKGTGLLGPTNASTAKLVALDAKTGKALWNSEHLDAGANAPTMTYKVDGKQYVAIVVGGNSLFGSKTGDSVYAFKLP
jgi:PQQ-dependent dehydrogenase (methanol/ethanol family)